MTRKVPVWLLGLANLPLGVTGGVALMLTPQILAERGVPEPRIADITTLALLGTFVFFVLAPALDVGFSRRTWAIGLSVLTAVFTALAVLNFGNLETLGVWLMLGQMSALLNTSAIGGWFGSVMPKDQDGPLGAWMNVSNVVGGGATAMAGVALARAAPPVICALVLGGLNLLPLLVFALVHPPIEERRRLAESFGRFGREMLALGRDRKVLRLLALFLLPCASFALTNTLGGLGGDYHVSEALVGLVFGVGVTVAGLLGSLAVPLLAGRANPLWAYVGIGAVGGAGTLSLLVAPHTPAGFVYAAVSQNVWQAASLGMVNVIALQSIGKDNPLAATQFAVLTAACVMPIAYMQWLDGHAYGAGMLKALYLTDGGLGLAACAVMAAVLVLTRTTSLKAAAVAA